MPPIPWATTLRSAPRDRLASSGLLYSLRSFARTSSLTARGSAWPFVSFITWPTKNPSRPFLAAAVGRDLTRVRGDHRVDDRLQLGEVGDHLLGEVRVGRETRLAEPADRLVECRARDPVACLHEPRKLAGGDRGRVDAGCDDVVRDHVRGGDAVRACGNGRLPEAVQAAGDEHERALVIEPLGDVTDPLCREDG